MSGESTAGFSNNVDAARENCSPASRVSFSSSLHEKNLAYGIEDTEDILADLEATLSVV